MQDLSDILFPFFLIFSPIFLIGISLIKKQNIFLLLLRHILAGLLKLLSIVTFGSCEHISKILKDFDENC